MKKQSAFFAVILIFVCAIALTACNGKDNGNVEQGKPETEVVNVVGNTSGNLANMGIAALQGDWIYYTCNDDGKAILSKIRTDGTGKTKLSESDTGLIVGINVVGDWIYYSDATSIYKIRTNGKDKTLLNEDAGGALSVSVVGDWIYYDAEVFSLYKMRTDGTDVTKVTDEKLFCFNIIGDWIYYINFDTKVDKDDQLRLCKMRTDGTANTEVGDIRAAQFNVVDDWIYYRGAGEEGFYKSRLDGSDNTQISDFRYGIYGGMMNVGNGWIYFKNIDDNNYLYKMRTDGTDITKLCNDDSQSICVVGDWIYYNFYDYGEDEYNPLTYRIRTDGTDKEKVD